MNYFVKKHRRGYADNPTNTTLVVGAVAAAAILAFVFWPKKATAQTPGVESVCGTAHEVKSFIAAKGLGVQIVDNAPTAEVPPTGYNTATQRVYAKCSFYRYLSLDGAKSTWVKDTALNAEFTTWKAK